MIKNVYLSSCKVPIIIVRLSRNFKILHSLSKNTLSNFMKIRPVGAELFDADRRTGMTKLIVAFRKFANAPNNKRTKQTPRIFR